jgi:hypothetical protein
LAAGSRKPDESGHEPVVREVVLELVVDLQERVLQVGAHAESHAKHRLHLRDREGRPDAMAGRVTEHHQEPLLDHGEIERVAAAQVRGPEGPVHVVPRNGRHGRGQEAHLHHARHLELLAHLFALDQRLGHLHPLQRDRALRREDRGQVLVGRFEDAAVGLVEDLHHAHENALVVHQRQVSMQRVRYPVRLSVLGSNRGSE